MMTDCVHVHAYMSYVHMCLFQELEVIAFFKPEDKDFC